MRNVTHLISDNRLPMNVNIFILCVGQHNDHWSEDGGGEDTIPGNMVPFLAGGTVGFIIVLPVSHGTYLCLGNFGKTIFQCCFNFVWQAFTLYTLLALVNLAWTC